MKILSKVYENASIKLFEYLITALYTKLLSMDEKF